MAMPPHMGGPHPPPVHSPLAFPSPILPPSMSHSYAVHSFPQAHVPHPSPSAHSSHASHQSHPSHSTAAAVAAASVSIAVGSGNSALLTHPSPMLSQPSPIYNPQTSVYVNPYLPPQLSHAHAHSHPQHQHPSSMGYGIPPPPMAGGPPPGILPPPQSSSQAAAPPLPSGPVMSVDEELLEEMNTLHLGYIETEDSPHKLEQREKLERVIMEYLAITPHSHKFMFHQISDVLETSINTCSDFSAYSAACAFDALAQYAANLITQPWRREFRQIKLYSGFWVHQVAHHLAGAESILSLMGYAPQSGPTAGSSGCRDPSCLVLEDVLDPDLISRLALDCLIAYCECQVLKKISEGVREFGLSWRQILQYRQMYVGGIDVTVRHLLFTLRQRLQPQSQAESSHKQAAPSTGPPLPVRQSSMSGPSSSPVSTHQSVPAPHSASEKVITPADQTMSLEPQQQPRSGTAGISRGGSMEQRSGGATGGGGGGGGGGGSGGGGGGGGGGSYHHPSLHHLHHHPSSQLPTVITTTAAAGAVPGTASGPPPSYARSVDTPDTAKSISSLGILPLASQVPTAKLIDLDSSLENLPSRNSLQLLPKVLPHKRSSKSSGSSRVLPSLENSDPCPPPPPPPEVFLAGTLDEHLEATLSIVKDPNRNSVVQSTPNEQGATSWETWEFVYRGLEKKGYNKDIGDRGDILHQITRQNLHPDALTPQGKNAPLNNKKEVGKSKPMFINQALQALALNETRERVERPCLSSKSSHSASHGAAPDVFPGLNNLTKRNSLFDNLSTGFETAPQDSDEYEDRRQVLKKTSNLARVDNRLDVSNKNNTSSSSSPRSLSLSSKGSHSRQELPPEAPRSAPAAAVPTLQHGGGGIAITDNSPTPPRDNQPPRESLLPQVPWSCTTCTFLNEKGRTACDMCGKSRTPGPETRPLISGGRQCPQCTLINEREAKDCSACGVHLEGSSTYI